MQYGSSSEGIWEMLGSLLSIASGLANYPENQNAMQREMACPQEGC